MKPFSDVRSPIHAKQIDDGITGNFRTDPKLPRENNTKVLSLLVFQLSFMKKGWVFWLKNR